jgi:hypothetical protein
VISLLTHNDGAGNALYVGGEFLTMNGVNTPRLAKWNGAVWSSLGTGLDQPVWNLATYNGSLIIGGAFDQANGSTAHSIARWGLGPFFTQHPADVTVVPNNPASFSVVTSAGERTAVSYQWRRNGANLTNGGPISGATSPALVINPVSVSHAGIYDVVASNSCGSRISGRGTLTINTCPEDVTSNQVVNVEDLLSVIGAWGGCPGTCPPHCPADIVQNCTVNVADLLAVIAVWGPC